MAFLSLTAIVVTFASALLLLTFILSSSLNGYGAANVFAYHAAFMVVGFVLLMPLSALSYKLDCGSRGNSVYPSRDSRRVLHGTLGLLAALFVLLGYMVAFVYHQAQGKPHMPFSEPATNSPTARSAHVVIGLIAIGCTLLQVVMGLYKFVQLEKVDVKVFSSLHAHLGPLAWLLGLLCISLAAYFEYKEKDEVPPKRAWTLGQAAAIWVALFALAAAVAVQHRFGSTAHLASAGSLRGENDEDDVGSIGRGRRASSSGSQRLLLGNNNS